jgi:hypothetical protein
MPGQVAEDRNGSEDSYRHGGRAANGIADSCQPELSNEPPPPAEGVEWLPPLLGAGDPAAGDAGSGTGAGGVVGAGAGEGSGVLEASVEGARTGAEAAGVEAARMGTDGLRGRARGCAGAAEKISIGGAALRRTGIAALTDADGRLDDASAREEPPEPVARPIAKQQANTASTDATRIGQRRSLTALALIARIPRGSMRRVFMTLGT